MKKILALLFFLFSFLMISAQPPLSSGSWQWARTIGSGGTSINGDETVNQSAIDSKGNVYVCGKVFGFAAQNGYNNSNAYIWQNNSQQNGQQFKGFVAKYSCQGELLWYKTLGDSLGYSAFFDMLIDENDNLFVTGYSTFGYARTFWGDSLIYNQLPLGQLTGVPFGMMMKINTLDGSINWINSPILNMGSLVNWNFNYYWITLSRLDFTKFHHMDTRGDTLVYIGLIDSIPNSLTADSSELNLIYFQKNYGQFLGRKKIMKIDYNKSDFFINGFYRYRGNYLALLTVQDSNLTFMGKPLHTPEASSGGLQWGVFHDAVPILLTFNDDSLIDQQVFEDSLLPKELKINKYTNQIDFSIYSYSNKTKIEKSSVFQIKNPMSLNTNDNFPSGVVHLDDIHKFKFFFYS